MFIGYCIVC